MSLAADALLPVFMPVPRAQAGHHQNHQVSFVQFPSPTMSAGQHLYVFVLGHVESVVDGMRSSFLYCSSCLLQVRVAT